MRTPLAIAALVWITLAPAASTKQRLFFHELSIPIGNGPRVIAVADLNHDGKLDLIAANESSETITVLLGDGRGRFSVAKELPIPSGHLPNDIAVADMNHDGNLDLVIANHQSPFIRILLGDGKGGFSLAPGSPVDVHSNPHPHGVAVGAFGPDHNLDVVTDSWENNQIELLHGDGTGRLHTPGRFFPVGHRPYERLRSADFNKDGHPDVVTTNLDDDTLTILLGDGHGGFQQARGSPFPAGPKPWQVAIDDLNRDGNTDLVVIPYARDVQDKRLLAVTVLLGNGKGQFTPLKTGSLSLLDCQGPNSIATGDFSGDGYRDIAVSCAESKQVIIFLGHPGGEYTRFIQPAEGGWGSIAVADLNGDGRDDLITANNGNGTITIYFSQ
jgi:FG-GAP-like repeat/FG-GAP repeat